MDDLKVGDKAWMTAVWTKGSKHNKVYSLVTEVTIISIFDDGTCLANDPEEIGMYVKLDELMPSKNVALVLALKALQHWEQTQGD